MLVTLHHNNVSARHFLTGEKACSGAQKASTPSHQTEEQEASSKVPSTTLGDEQWIFSLIHIPEYKFSVLGISPSLKGEKENASGERFFLGLVLTPCS